MKSARDLLRYHEKKTNGDLTGWQEDWIVEAMDAYAEQMLEEIYFELGEDYYLWDDDEQGKLYPAQRIFDAMKARLTEIKLRNKPRV